MLEILLIWILAKKIGAMASNKGRNAAGYIVLFVLAWFGGEILGAIFGAVLNKGEFFPTGYLFALVGAAVGAGSAFIIVGALPAIEEEDYRPRRKRRRREREEEVEGEDSYRSKFKPRRTKPRDETEDEEEPETRYRRRRRHEDE